MHTIVLGPGRSVHPCLGNIEHEIAMARVVREFGPTEAIERECAHFVRRGHDYAAILGTPFHSWFRFPSVWNRTQVMKNSHLLF